MLKNLLEAEGIRHHVQGVVVAGGMAVGREGQSGLCPVWRGKADYEEYASDQQKDDPCFVTLGSLREN